MLHEKDIEHGYEIDFAAMIDAKQLFAEAIGVLSEKARSIVVMRLYGSTLKECAKVFSMTRERVRQVELKAYRDMGSHFGIDVGRLRWDHRNGSWR